MRKRILLVAIFTLSVWLHFGFSQVSAQNLNQSCLVNPNSALCKEHQATNNETGGGLYGPDGTLTNIANMISIITGIAAVVLIMLAGFRFITAAGDANQLSTARRTITYAIIGLVVAVTGQMLVIFVLNRVS